jgi:hypothetical protein
LQAATVTSSDTHTQVQRETVASSDGTHRCREAAQRSAERVGPRPDRRVRGDTAGGTTRPQPAKSTGGGGRDVLWTRRRPPIRRAKTPYVLNTRSEAKNTILYIRFIFSLLCVYINLEYVRIYAKDTGLPRRKTGFVFLWVRLRNTSNKTQVTHTTHTTKTKTNTQTKTPEHTHTHTHHTHSTTSDSLSRAPRVSMVAIKK